MPWKNGGGETIEIAAFPDGASLDTFGWRVSMARVAGDGPFSRFDGVDRTLAILDGAGLVLSVDGRDVTLTQATAPHAFPGDAPTSARLLAGPITDLNTMTRRGAFTHAVAHLTAPATRTGELVLVLARAPLTISDGTTRVELERDDAAIAEGGAALTVDGAVDGYAITLTHAR
jgi:environmental stress-induced protein Ves